MAAPAVLDQLFVRFRDARGNTSRLKVNIGDATHAATVTDLGTLVTHLGAVTNASVVSGLDPRGNFTYGTNAEFPNVEDGAQLVFKDDVGTIHRFKIPAPKIAIFLDDGDTVDPGNAAVIALVGDFQTFVYANDLSDNPLTYVGGIRLRHKARRRLNIFVKNPALTGPGE